MAWATFEQCSNIGIFSKFTLFIVTYYTARSVCVGHLNFFMSAFQGALICEADLGTVLKQDRFLF